MGTVTSIESKARLGAAVLRLLRHWQRMVAVGCTVQVFCFTGDKAHEEMRSACFDYLRLGGIYSAGPISLLSGLNPRPSVLVTHFFMVAVFGFGRWAATHAAVCS